MWWMHTGMHSFIRVFHDETVCRSVERRGELHAQEYDMQSQRLRNAELRGVFVYLNPGRNKDAMTKQQTGRITLGSIVSC